MKHHECQIRLTSHRALESLLTNPCRSAIVTIDRFALGSLTSCIEYDGTV